MCVCVLLVIRMLNTVSDRYLPVFGTIFPSFSLLLLLLFHCCATFFCVHYYCCRCCCCCCCLVLLSTFFLSFTLLSTCCLELELELELVTFCSSGRRMCQHCEVSCCCCCGAAVADHCVLFPTRCNFSYPSFHILSSTSLFCLYRLPNPFTFQ